MPSRYRNGELRQANLHNGPVTAPTMASAVRASSFSE